MRTVLIGVGVAVAALWLVRRRVRRFAVLLQTPVIHLKDLGSVRGELVGEVVRFLAIPYARHVERWRAPEAPEPWAGVRDNAYVLPIAPQPEESVPRSTFSGHRVETNEKDCLVVNVFSPRSALVGGELLPVIFYIHGGAGKHGSCHEPEHSNGQELATQQNVVYIAPNYRLGALGWLAHEALLDEGDACGNAGLLDLVCALQWVQQHARSFGGDPANVTIWGLSTGSQLVATLLVSPLARGLFARAVMQSCADLCNVRDLERRQDVWLGKSACEWGAAFATSLGCRADTPAAQLEAMRRLPTSAFIDSTWARESMDCYEPAVHRARADGPKPLTSLEALLHGRYAVEVPVMLGVTCADGLGKMELEWTMFEDVTTVGAYERLLAKNFGPDRLAAAKQAFGARNEAEVTSQLGVISECLWYSAATVRMADLLALHRTPAYVYRVTEEGFTRHGSDSPLWNGVSRARDARGPGKEPAGAATSRAAMAYLCNFARTGDPNGVGRDGKSLPHWERHTQGADGFMELGPNLGMHSPKEPAMERARFALAWEHLESISFAID